MSPRRLDEEARREQRRRLLGPRDAKCQNPSCGERDPISLTGAAPDTWCVECRARSGGRSPVERHHPAGRHNDPDTTVAIPANDHAHLTDIQQQEWPVETLRNPAGSPLLRAAASVRGWVDVLRLILNRTVGWVPDMLERLDQILTQKMGPSWWEHLALDEAASESKEER